MGIIERKSRAREAMRTRILDTAWHIGKTEGWGALSMRKIAEIIEYTSPAIYQHFASKEAILLALTKMGYRRLEKRLRHVFSGERDIRAVWQSYLDFAFSEKEFYQLMFGIEMPCPLSFSEELPESSAVNALLLQTIKGLYGDMDPDPEELRTKFYICWSAVHGLAALNLTRNGDQIVSGKIIIDEVIGWLEPGR